MNLSDAGYSNCQFSTPRLRKVAHEVARRLPGLMAQLGADSVAVTGKSGVALAFATLMLIDFPLIVVRKRGENSHGNPVEGTPGHEYKRYVILDDFISTGGTVNNIADAIDEYASSAGGEGAECVGVLQYLRSENSCGAGGCPRNVYLDGLDDYVPAFGVHHVPG